MFVMFDNLENSVTSKNAIIKDIKNIKIRLIDTQINTLLENHWYIQKVALKKGCPTTLLN